MNKRMKKFYKQIEGKERTFYSITPRTSAMVYSFFQLGHVTASEWSIIHSNGETFSTSKEEFEISNQDFLNE